VLGKHKGMILGVTFLVAALAVGGSLLMPNIYTGITRILPPQQSQSSASAMLSQLGGLAGMAGGALGAKNPNDLYIGMLKSRTITERIARRFDLQSVYGRETMDDTLKRLSETALNVTSGADGFIVVEVDDVEPKRAADMANAFVEELSVLVKTYALTDAANKRVFFEQQMKDAKDKLTNVELVLDRTPNTSLEYLDAMRNLKYQEAVYEILAKQYEMAKLDEAKDFPLIQILDKALIPEKRSAPKRSLIVILATIAAFFIAVILAFIREGLSKSESDPEQRVRLQELRQIFGWKK
jgi:uncharacterized protein involved in exopolysaccharide biosynthesis